MLSRIDSESVDPKSQIPPKKGSVSESLFFHFTCAGAGLYCGLTTLLEMDRVSAAAIAVISAVSSLSAYSRFEKMAEADTKRRISPAEKASLCFILIAGISTLFWTRLNIKIPITPQPTYSSSGSGANYHPLGSYLNQFWPYPNSKTQIPITPPPTPPPSYSFSASGANYHHFRSSNSYPNPGVGSNSRSYPPRNFFFCFI